MPKTLMRNFSACCRATLAFHKSKLTKLNQNSKLNLKKNLNSGDESLLTEPLTEKTDQPTHSRTPYKGKAQIDSKNNESSRIQTGDQHHRSKSP